MENVVNVLHATGFYFKIFCIGMIYLSYRAYGETAVIDSKPYCRGCESKKFPDSKAAFEKSDAKFFCPMKKCGADNLTFEQVYIGSCCEDASKWKPTRI